MYVHTYIFSKGIKPILYSSVSFASFETSLPPWYLHRMEEKDRAANSLSLKIARERGQV